MAGIRLAEPQDADSIAGLMQLTWPDQSSQGQIPAVIGNPDHATYVAFDGETPVGFIDGFRTCARNGTLRWEVDLLAVHPDWRAQGIGRGLVSACMQSAVHHQAVTARGLIQVENIASQCTFRSSGFILIPQILELYVSHCGNGNIDPQDSKGTFIPVQTLSYCGLWLEDDFSPAALNHAQAERARKNLDLVGALIPAVQKDSILAAQAAGYSRVNSYQWWQKVLTTQNSRYSLKEAG